MQPRLTKQDVANFFRVSTSTIDNWRNRKEKPFPKPRLGQQGRGCKCLWAIEDIEKWERQCQQ